MIKKRTPFILLAATALLGIFLKNDFIRFLLGFELILYAAAFFQTHYLAAHISGELWIDQNIARKNETFPLKVRLKNQGRIPASEIFVRIALKVFPDKEEVLLTGHVMLDAGEEGFIVFDIDSSHCGCMEARLERIMVQDYLGLFQRRFTGHLLPPKLIYFFPGQSNVPSASRELDIFPEGEDGCDVHRGRTGEDFIGIRTYQNGDLFKMVHWKLSARMNDLIVKELGKTGEQVYWIYLNLEEPQKTSGKNAKPRDRALWDSFFENTETLCLSLLKAGQPFRIVWVDYDKKTIREYLVTDKNSYQEMMCFLLHTDSYLPQDGRDLVKELPLYEMESEIIEIRLQGDPTGRTAGDGKYRS